MSRRYPRTPTPSITITAAAGLYGDAPTEEPMIIKFASVQLHKTVPRLDAGIGQATQETTFFDVARAKVSIEYDTASQLVRIAKGHACVYIPIAGVERFGPTLEDAATFEKAKAASLAAAAASITNA